MRRLIVLLTLSCVLTCAACGSQASTPATPTPVVSGTTSPQQPAVVPRMLANLPPGVTLATEVVGPDTLELVKKRGAIYVLCAYRSDTVSCGAIGAGGDNTVSTIVEDGLGVQIFELPNVQMMEELILALQAEGFTVDNIRPEDFEQVQP